MLDVELGDFKLFIYNDPRVLPKWEYVYGFQPNLLTEFDVPGPYKIQFMPSYLDLCTPIPPLGLHESPPKYSENTRL